MMARRVIAGRGGFSPKALFAAGEQGVWYDPSDFSTLFQDSAGTTPVTAVEQPVGLMLDKRSTPYSVFFDGSGDYLSVPDSAAFTLGSGDFTFEAWVYSGITGSRLFVCGQSNSAGSGEYSVWLEKFNTNKFRSVVRTSLNVEIIAISTANIPVNTWVHLAFVRNGNTGTQYINGVADGTCNLTGVTVKDSTSNFAVGALGEYTAGATWNGYISNFRLVKGTAVYTSNFTPPTSPLSPITGTSLLTCGTSWTGNPAITKNGDARVDGFNPFTASPVGNHATQSTTTSRPTLSARYNLLTKTEQFDDAYWFTLGIIINVNSTTAPDGTETADLLTVNLGYSTKMVRNNSFPLIAAGIQLTGSVYLKAGTHNFYSVSVTNTTSGNIFAVATVNLSSGQVTKTGTGPGGGTIVGTPTCVSLGNGWFRVSLTATYPSGSSAILWVFANSSGTPKYNSADYGAESWTSAGTETGYIWGADLRVANDAAGQPAYQRVNTDSDYDTVGFKPYLRFDGSNDWLVTNTITPGTDKMTVFAGVRKLSDAALGMVAELSASAGANIGTFNTYANGPSGLYEFNSRGTSVGAASITGYAAPRTDVLTGQGNISGDSAILRINGAQAASSTADQGTGNYGNYPLYIGARAGSSLYFNGRLYSLIVRNAQTPANLIAATERYVARKTGVTL